MILLVCVALQIYWRLLKIISENVEKYRLFHFSGMYDGQEHTPKLLQCSHTVCLHCLTRIAASQTRDSGSFRCPICRELINIPRGGVSALPPSFLVNQLLDLMSRQRREVIPKCSVHINQELLFCETCDTVFCTLCTSGSHNDTSNTCEHTIIPFSIAIKRMSEILLYKANDCISKVIEWVGIFFRLFSVKFCRSLFIIDTYETSYVKEFQLFLKFNNSGVVIILI